MPTLNWIGKEKVVNHHQDVTYIIYADHCLLDKKIMDKYYIQENS